MSKKYRVLTWNVLYRSLSERLSLQLPVLEEINADVILLQESGIEHSRAIADHLGMNLAVMGESARADAAVANSILIRGDVANARRFRLQDDGHEYLVADIDDEGRTLRFSTTHIRHTVRAGRLGVDPDYRLAATNPDGVSGIADASIADSVKTRMRQLAEIATIRQSSSRCDFEILTGDFNFVPDGPEYHQVMGWGMRDAWRSGPRLGSGATILERNPLVGDGRGAYAEIRDALMRGAHGDLDYTLDYQFYAGEGAPGLAWIVGEPVGGSPWPSDHLGIVVEYSV